MSRKEQPLRYCQCTDSQARCWDTLAEAIHIDRHHVYSCGHGIRTSIIGEAATHDLGLLTSLVLLAHRDCVRIAITSAGPRRIGITAHPRDPLSQFNMSRSQHVVRAWINTFGLDAVLARHCLQIKEPNT